DDIGNRVVVDMAVSGHDRFHTRDAFLLGLVRQHGAANDVTQRIDAIHVGPETFVDLHEATLVLLDAQLLQPQSIRVRHAAYRHQHAVAGDGFATLHLDGTSLPLLADTGNLDAQPELEPLFGEHALGFLRDPPVHPRQNAIEVLQDFDLRPQA